MFNTVRFRIAFRLLAAFESDACGPPSLAATPTSIAVSWCASMRVSALLLVLALACAAAADAVVTVPFDDCGSKVMAILNVTVRASRPQKNKKNKKESKI